MRITRSLEQTGLTRPQTVSRRTKPSGEQKPCGHSVHVGTCAMCQRAQLARWRAQLAEAA